MSETVSQLSDQRYLAYSLTSIQGIKGIEGMQGESGPEQLLGSLRDDSPRQVQE